MMRFIVFIAALVCTSAAFAQPNYPSRPVRMVIPWPPGQATDLVGRVIAQKMAELIGQPVVTDNRPGAGGMIGTDVVARAAPDGYTILAASSGPVTINPLLQKVPYDPERDLVPVANVGLSPYMLVTSATFPAKSALDLIALIKASPGKYSFSSSGTGATAHLVAEWFNNINGLKATHVPYKGSAPSLIDVVGGQVAYSLETAAATLPHIRAGRLKAYGVSLARGSTLAPEIPPLAKVANMPAFDVGAWLGVMVAKGTPPAIVQRLTAVVDQTMQTGEVREKMAAAGVEVDYRRTEEFTRYLKEQKTRFAEIIRQGNIRIE